MIKDELRNCETYFGLSNNIKKGFEWLINTDLKNIKDGRYYIDGENVFANVQTYLTKEDAPFEGHRKYIDIQYMIKGSEKIGLARYKDCKTTENYNAEKDIEFLSCESNYWHETLKEGEFLVFYPQDAHQPALDFGDKKEVKKVIVKVAV